MNLENFEEIVTFYRKCDFMVKKCEKACRNLRERSRNGHVSYYSGKKYDICPKCGEATLVYEEGCKKCYSCGYSEC